jgi:hypothetical protein
MFLCSQTGSKAVDALLDSIADLDEVYEASLMATPGGFAAIARLADGREVVAGAETAREAVGMLCVDLVVLLTAA